MFMDDCSWRYVHVKRLDADAVADVNMLLSYDEEEIGRYMTTNYVCIKKGLAYIFLIQL